MKIFVTLLFFVIICPAFGQSDSTIVRIGDFRGMVYDLCLTPSGKSLIVPETNRMAVYELPSRNQTGKFTDGHSGNILAVDLSADTALLASADQNGLIVIREFPGGEILQKLTYHQGSVTTVAFHPNHHLLYSGGHDRSLVAFDVDKDTLAFRIDPFVREITSIKVSPDGQMLAVSTLDQTILLYDALTGRFISQLDGHKSSVRDLAFDSTGEKLYSCGDDSRLIVWNLKQPAQPKILRNEHFGSDWLLSVAVSPLNDIYATAGISQWVYLSSIFSRSVGRLNYPINKLLFYPGLGSMLKFIVATRGNGILVVDSFDFKVKNR